MWRGPLRFCLLIGLFLFQSGLSSGQERLLRYHWNERDVFLLEKTVDLTGTIQMEGQPARPMSQTVFTRRKITVVHVSSEGRAELESSLIAYSATKTIDAMTNRIEADPERLRVDGVLLFDRQRDEERVSHIARRHVHLFRNRTFWCSNQGETRSALRQEGIRQKLSQSDLSSVFGIGQEGWLLLPDSAVRQGSSWSRSPESGVIRDGTAEVGYLQEYRVLEMPAPPDETVRIGLNYEWRGSHLYLPTHPPGLETDREFGAWLIEKKERFETETLFDTGTGYPLVSTSRGAVYMEYHVTRTRYYPGEPSPRLIYNWPEVRVETRWEKLK